MQYPRASGIILHPTSLPSPDGIGDLGPEAYRWINFLHQSGTRLWQVLPLGPTGYGDSPYQSFSAFAGNPYLISPALLLEDELLQPDDLADRPVFPDDQVAYGDVIHWKLSVLDRAYRNFSTGQADHLRGAYEDFIAVEKSWLDDYALFMAVKASQGGVAWNEWSAPLRGREENALEEFRRTHAQDIEKTRLGQFLFFRQWRNLRDYAHKKEIQIIGDIPIFVAYDSADVWANADLFYLDERGLPKVVAGVPPDYFSATGQLWGNPLYRWKLHQQRGYEWWIRRIQASLNLVDILRIDHFRGFAGYWEVPFGEKTAELGRWVQGPGADFFSNALQVFGALPIIAEDLGEITRDVTELRDQFNLPGMKILQFAFAGGSEDPFLPHNYPVNCVAYTGTHDNDTTWGWYNSATEHERDFVRRYLARSGDDIAWSMMRAIWSSAAVMVLSPMQDLLNLGTEARMNYPGEPSGNWTWRMAPDALGQGLVERLRELNRLYSRLVGQPERMPREYGEYQDPDSPPIRERPERQMR